MLSLGLSIHPGLVYQDWNGFQITLMYKISRLESWPTIQDDSINILASFADFSIVLAWYINERNLLFVSYTIPNNDPKLKKAAWSNSPQQ